MDKDSTYELQNVDCNCNNCIFLYRDITTWQKWHDWHKDLEFIEFKKSKEKAIAEALLIEDEPNRNGMLRTANKMKFQFDKSKLISYGKCSRLGKEVRFLPNTCQLNTQSCFMHRKEFTINTLI
jgi:hypothetical protein